jgi:O-antigen/teichoic acid export membrane protein
MGVIARQSIKGTIVTYVGAFIGFLTTFFILTRYLTAEEIGLARVLQDTSVMLSGLASLGTSSSIIRFFPRFSDERSKNHGFFFWTLIVPLIGFIIFAILYIALKGPAAAEFGKNSALFVNYFYFVLPMTFAMLYMTIFETNSNVLMRIVVPKFVREVLVRILALATYVLYAFRVLNIDGFVIAFCAVYGIAALVDLIYLISLGKISFRPERGYISKALVKEWGFYTLFLVVSSLASQITPFLNTYFVSAKMGLTYTGIFAIATYISSVVEIPYRSLGAIAQPNLSADINARDFKAADTLCKQVSLHQFLISSALFFIIWINIDFIFLLLPNGNQYAVAKWVVFFLCTNKMVQTSLSIPGSALSYSKYYYFSLIFTAIMTVVAIILNNTFIPLWGINGAALATLASTAVNLLLSLPFIKWKLKISPFSLPQLKVVAILVFLFGINWVWVKFLTPVFMKLPFIPLGKCAIDRCLCTILIVAVGVFAVYKWHISDSVNRYLDKILHIKTEDGAI